MGVMKVLLVLALLVVVVLILDGFVQENSEFAFIKKSAQLLRSTGDELLYRIDIRGVGGKVISTQANAIICPEDDCENKIATAINKSETSVKISLASLDSVNITRAIASARSKGVETQTDVEASENFLIIDDTTYLMQNQHFTSDNIIFITNDARIKELYENKIGGD